jgi:hypothetical protein
MLQTKSLIEQARQDARELDQMLIQGRERIITNNISDIQGRRRSEKYVARKAGTSPDVDMASASQFYVEWIGATALEDPERSALVGEFLRPLLSYAHQRPIFTLRDFFDVDEDVTALLCHARKAHILGDTMGCRQSLIQAKSKIDEMLQIDVRQTGVLA